nr:response regulator [Legionella sp. km772]
MKVKLLKQMKNEVLLKFSVTDSGIGIPFELQAKVFDKFFRIPPKQGAYSGHGLGLHIAQSYAHLLSGNILLTSKPGQGTTFYFELVVKVGEAGQLPLEQNKPDKSKLPEARNKIPVAGAKLMLVEDNTIALLTLETLVSQAGFNYRSVGNGQHALDLIKAEPFDLIITDLDIPGLSGLELSREIRKYEQKNQLKAVPIIGLTADDEKKIKSRCIKAGMNDAISKPIDREALEKITQAYLLASPGATIQNTPMATPQQPAADKTKSLLQLDTGPVLDVECALISLGNNADLLRATFKCMVEQEMPKSIRALETAYKAGDWLTIKKLVHQMKGGLVYCGAIKLINACHYLEQQCQAGPEDSRHSLYQELRVLIDETIAAIKAWLDSK